MLSKVDRIDVWPTKADTPQQILRFNPRKSPSLGAHSSFGRASSGSVRGAGGVEVEVEAVGGEAIPTSCSSPRKAVKDRLQHTLRASTAAARFSSRDFSVDLRFCTRREPSKSQRRRPSPSLGAFPPALILSAKRALASALTLRSVSGTRGAELFACRGRGGGGRVSSFALVQGPAVLARLSSLNPSLH